MNSCTLTWSLCHFSVYHSLSVDMTLHLFRIWFKITGDVLKDSVALEVEHWCGDVRRCLVLAEMAKVHTCFTQEEVKILVFKNTLVKVEVLTKLLYSGTSKEVWASKCA